MASQKTIPTLHNLASSQAFRCLWALEEIKARNPSFIYRLKNYPRTKSGLDALKQAHPLGKSPTLTLETTDNSPPPTIQLDPGVLTESRLILNFINTEYGNNLYTPLPSDSQRDEFFTEFAISTLASKVNYILIFEIPVELAPFPINFFFKLVLYPLNAHRYNDLYPVFQILEDKLSDEKPWFGGSKVGLSDLNMSWGMGVAEQRGYFKGEEYPRLKEWSRRIKELEGYKAALREAGTYDLVTFDVPKDLRKQLS